MEHPGNALVQHLESGFVRLFWLVRRGRGFRAWGQRFPLGTLFRIPVNGLRHLERWPLSTTCWLDRFNTPKPHSFNRVTSRESPEARTLDGRGWAALMCVTPPP
jgi:hypothetical protein